MGVDWYNFYQMILLHFVQSPFSQAPYMYSTPKNLLCFSHLRWDFVYQRPQHLLTRFAEHTAVYFLEEPIFCSTDTAYLTFSRRAENLWVCVPHLPHGLNGEDVNARLRELLDFFFINKNASDFTFWYYTPMALTFSRHIEPGLTVFDCMDELSAFKFAPDELRWLESELFERADVVFTGGHSLYESKKKQHHNTHCFPSSIEKEHFALARTPCEPVDQAVITGPKIGFYGVIDERFDIELIRGIADARPGWHIVLIGPVVKIDPAHLPKNKNIHYLGARSYDQLPGYLSGWDVALIPFVLNDSTRFISPTKTPEYLAGGKPVVSTPIRDVVSPYGENSLVSIGKNAAEFVAAIDRIMADSEKGAWLEKVDKFLADNSWDHTHKAMHKAMRITLDQQDERPLRANPVLVSLKVS